jgi:iron complex transport system permease protein
MVDYRLRIEKDLATLPANGSAGSVGSSTDSSPSRVRRRAMLFLVLVAVGIFVFLLSLSWSSVAIPIDEIVRILFGQEPERAAFRTIIMDIRLPRVLTAMLVGAALGIAGLQMQTTFRNPLADPFTLGVLSGASFGAAITIIFVPMFLSGIAATDQFVAIGVFGNLSTVAGSTLGAAAILGIMLMLASRVRDMTIVLLAGLVIASLLEAIVTIFVFFADRERTRAFVEWGLGSFYRVRWDEMPFLGTAVLIGLFAAFLTSKALNALLLGENYAQSMGLNIRQARLLILGSASLMAGAVVAYCGPIGFLGIAIPHLARGLFGTSDNRVLVPATILIGIVLALACGILAELPGSSITLPLNAATALFGGPIALSVLFRMRKRGSVL